MSTFECKDCGEVFPNVELFVYHVDTCVPRKPGLTPKEVQDVRDLLNLLLTDFVETDDNDMQPMLRRGRRLIKRMDETL